MKIEGTYSYNKGVEALKKERPAELQEVIEAITSLNAPLYKTKASKEITMPGRLLYAPKELNKALLTDLLYTKGWTKPKVFLKMGARNFIEGDGVKNDVGLEVQFGKYAFLGWDIFGKMPIFAKEGKYKYGIEVVPMAALRRQMSTGIGSYEQIVNILEKRGVSNLDIPVVVLGINID